MVQDPRNPDSTNTYSAGVDRASANTADMTAIATLYLQTPATPIAGLAVLTDTSWHAAPDKADKCWPRSKEANGKMNPYGHNPRKCKQRKAKKTKEEKRAARMRVKQLKQQMRYEGRRVYGTPKPKKQVRP